MSKKEFAKDNPAMAFISSGQTQKSESDGEIKYKLDPRYVETKSKRLQLLVQPTVHNELKKYAAAHELSVNEAANQALKSFLHLDM